MLPGERPALARQPALLAPCHRRRRRRNSCAAICVTAIWHGAALPAAQRTLSRDRWQTDRLPAGSGATVRGLDRVGICCGPATARYRAGSALHLRGVLKAALRQCGCRGSAGCAARVQQWLLTCRHAHRQSGVHLKRCIAWSDMTACACPADASPQFWSNSSKHSTNRYSCLFRTAPLGGRDQLQPCLSCRGARQSQPDQPIFACRVSVHGGRAPLPLSYPADGLALRLQCRAGAVSTVHSLPACTTAAQDPQPGAALVAPKPKAALMAHLMPQWPCLHYRCLNLLSSAVFDCHASSFVVHL